MTNFIFYGSDDFSINVLKKLIENNFKPNFCITQPDKPKGRKLVLTPPPIKTFCEENNIKVLQPTELNEESIPESDFSIVASYGKIIPKNIIELSKYGALNVHPSLLPKYRGATPIETAILNDDKNIGVSIILMDEKMDHGPIISQEKISYETWPNKLEVRNQLAILGGELLVKIVPEFIEKKGEVNKTEQNHEKATFTKMLKKDDGEIRESESTKSKWLKFIAYNPWPGTFFFIEKNNKKIRVKITDADFNDNEFIIKKVIPEGKSEMTFDAFKNGYLK